MSNTKINYIVEFKIGDLWIQTRPYEDCELAHSVEITLHDAGIKARVVVLVTSQEILGPPLGRG